MLLSFLLSSVSFAQIVPLRDWTAPVSTITPAMACGELRSLTNFEFTVVTANVVAASSAAGPEHCQVRIFIQPALNIEVKLPAAWNGRLYMFGNGGWAGESFDTPGRVTSAARGLKAGFITASTDTGHSAAVEPGASFALNFQELLDYGFRSLHLTAELAKTLAKNYYGGSGPRKSYYEGCSQGGREGLTLAQRFPNDFDGIIAGAPALNQTGTHLARAYWMKEMNANPFPASKLGLLAKSVYEQCDAKDGLKDGLIADPRACDFKPGRDLPRCSASSSDAENCFTADQIKALEHIYGDVMSQGKRFFPGWPVGAEVAGPNGQSGWLGQEINRPDGPPGAWTSYGYNFLRFIVPSALGGKVEDDPAAAFRRFDIDSAPAKAEDAHQIIDANDTDLTAFRKHGGKLLMYFGWADPQLNPRMGVEYFEAVQTRMGDSADFFRLFMVPGMFHCGGGVGTSVFDATTPLLDWVEAAKAPGRIEASRIAQGKVVRTRPLCSYPAKAKYNGSGSIDESANFSCAK